MVSDRAAIDPAKIRSRRTPNVDISNFIFVAPVLRHVTVHGSQQITSPFSAVQSSCLPDKGYLLGCRLAGIEPELLAGQRGGPWQMTCLPDTGTFLRSCAGVKPIASVQRGLRQGSSCIRQRLDAQRSTAGSQARRVVNNSGRKGRAARTCCPQAVSSGWEGECLLLYCYKTKIT